MHYIQAAHFHGPKERSAATNCMSQRQDFTVGLSFTAIAMAAFRLVENIHDASTQPKHTHELDKMGLPTERHGWVYHEPSLLQAVAKHGPVDRALVRECDMHVDPSLANCALSSSSNAISNAPSNAGDTSIIANGNNAVE